MTVVADGSLVTRATIVIATGSPVTNAAALADLLAKPLGLDRDKLMQTLRTGKPGTVLKKDLASNLADDLAKQMSDQALGGVELHVKKIWPMQQRASWPTCMAKPLSMDHDKAHGSAQLGQTLTSSF